MAFFHTWGYVCVCVCASVSACRSFVLSYCPFSVLLCVYKCHMAPAIFTSRRWRGSMHRFMKIHTITHTHAEIPCCYLTCLVFLLSLLYQNVRVCVCVCVCVCVSWLGVVIVSGPSSFLFLAGVWAFNWLFMGCAFYIHKYTHTHKHIDIQVLCLLSICRQKWAFLSFSSSSPPSSSPSSPVHLSLSD